MNSWRCRPRRRRATRPPPGPPGLRTRRPARIFARARWPLLRFTRQGAGGFEALGRPEAQAARNHDGLCPRNHEGPATIRRGAETGDAVPRQKSYQQLEAFLKEILTPEQLKRFAELKLQYDMPMIMLRPDVVEVLNVTDEQRQQFMTLIQEMQRVVGPLIQASRSGGNPQEILAKVTKLRLDCQGKIEALLSDAQKTQWKEMTGTPLVIW